MMIRERYKIVVFMLSGNNEVEEYASQALAGLNGLSVEAETFPIMSSMRAL
jgi:hypothetical protein